MENSSRITLITGGAQGLGKHLAEYLYNMGHRVIILDIQPYEKLKNAYKKIILDYYEVDIADLTVLDDVLNDICLKYKHIDILINNAALRLFKKYMDFSELEIERYIQVNFRAPIFLIKKILPMMKKNGYGRIINISSKSAFSGYISGSLYCSTKSALLKFSQAIGKELDTHSDNVTVNVICPDSISTAEGIELKGCNSIRNAVAKTIGQILVSNRNAESIPVLLKKTKLIEILSDIKKHLLWLTRY